MLDRWGSRLRIGLSRHGLVLVKTRRRQPSALLKEIALPEQDIATPELLAAGLRQILMAADRSPVSVVVADHWVRMMMVTPPQNLRSLQDCEAAAAMRFQALYGEPAADWQIVGDWSARQPFLACALPRAQGNTLQQLAAECHVTLLEVVPQFIAAWNCWHRAVRAPAWFGIVHEQILTLGVIDHKRLCAVRTLPLPDIVWQDGQWLPARLAQEALRLNLPAPAQLQLCGDLPGQWMTHTLDSLQCMRLDATSQPPRSAAIALACTGVTQ
jgi:hypothetical protein